MSMFEAFLKDTNQTKEEYEASIKGKYDDEPSGPTVVPLHNIDNPKPYVVPVPVINNSVIFVPEVMPIPMRIKCSQLKKSLMIVHDNKVWTIVSFNNIGSKTIRSFVAFHNDTNTKKEFIFPKTYAFDITNNGEIILP